jgi:peptidyl-prolyl cis-trans isomerase D
MLMSMRKHAKYFYVLFFIVILSFIFWGVGTVDKTGGAEIVAEVGNYKITAQEYWRTYDNVYRFYRNVYKDSFDEEMEQELNLKESVLNSMINERIIFLLAKDLNITVSDDELQDAITHDQTFMKNGVFDKDIYLNRLRLMRTTPEAYEESKRQELLITKIRNIIELSVDTSDIALSLPQDMKNAELTNMLSRNMINERKEKTLGAYIEGLKKEFKININQDVIG